MACYNVTRSGEQILEAYEDAAPSFSLHLHPDYWTLNNGPKFLYNNPVASLLDDVRAHRIPVDYLELFHTARVPFYDGCMLVELLDYRPKRAKDPPLEKPERSRVALHPNDETLWANLCLMNQSSGNKFTDSDVLDLEAQILLHTAPPLCLDPDPHLTRIANHTLRVSTPSIPVSLKRKAAAITPEEDESEKARRGKIMQFMHPRPTRSHNPSYRVLEAIRRAKEIRLAIGLDTQPYLKETLQAQALVQAQAQAQTLAHSQAHSQNQAQQIPPSMPTPQSQPARLQPTPVPTVPEPAPTPVPQPVSDQKSKAAKKIAEATQAFQINHNLEVSRSSATPAPHPTVNQLQGQPRHATSVSPRVGARSPLPPAQSPAHRYTQSPRPPSSQAPHSSPLAIGSQLPPTPHRPQTTSVHFVQVAPQGSQVNTATPQVGYHTQPTPPPAQAGQQAGATQPAAGQHMLQQHNQTQVQAHAGHPTQVQIYQLQQQHHQARMAQAVQAHAQAQAQAHQAQVQAQVQAQAQMQAGRMTPQNGQPRSPMPGHLARNSPIPQNQAKRSPMLQNQARSSPMTNATPLPQTIQTVQHPGMTPQYNFTPTQFRAAGQDQQQHAMMMSQYSMYPYIGYSVPGARMQPGYPSPWGAGRGMPNQVNGQAGAGVQMAVGKPTQGGGR